MVVAIMIAVQSVARCKFTIRIRMIVLVTTLIMTNTAGTVAVMVFRSLSDNGHESLVEPIMIAVVYSVRMLWILEDEGMEESIKHIVVLIPEFKQFCLHSYDDDDDDDNDDDDDTDQK